MRHANDIRHDPSPSARLGLGGTEGSNRPGIFDEEELRAGQLEKGAKVPRSRYLMSQPNLSFSRSSPFGRHIILLQDFDKMPWDPVKLNSGTPSADAALYTNFISNLNLQQVILSPA